MSVKSCGKEDRWPRSLLLLLGLVFASGVHAAECARDPYAATAGELRQLGRSLASTLLHLPHPLLPLKPYRPLTQRELICTSAPTCLEDEAAKNFFASLLQLLHQHRHRSRQWLQQRLAQELFQAAPPAELSFNEFYPLRDLSWGDALKIVEFLHRHPLASQLPLTDGPFLQTTLHFLGKLKEARRELPAQEEERAHQAQMLLDILAHPAADQELYQLALERLAEENRHREGALYPMPQLLAVVKTMVTQLREDPPGKDTPGPRFVATVIERAPQLLTEHQYDPQLVAQVEKDLRALGAVKPLPGRPTPPALVDPYAGDFMAIPETRLQQQLKEWDRDPERVGPSDWELWGGPLQLPLGLAFQLLDATVVNVLIEGWNLVNWQDRAQMVEDLIVEEARGMPELKEHFFDPVPPQASAEERAKIEARNEEYLRLIARRVYGLRDLGITPLHNAGGLKTMATIVFAQEMVLKQVQQMMGKSWQVSDREKNEQLTAIARSTTEDLSLCLQQSEEDPASEAVCLQKFLRSVAFRTSSALFRPFLRLQLGELFQGLPSSESESPLDQAITQAYGHFDQCVEVQYFAAEGGYQRELRQMQRKLRDDLTGRGQDHWSRRIYRQVYGSVAEDLDPMGPIKQCFFHALMLAIQRPLSAELEGALQAVLPDLTPAQRREQRHHIQRQLLACYQQRGLPFQYGKGMAAQGEAPRVLGELARTREQLYQALRDRRGEEDATTRKLRSKLDQLEAWRRSQGVWTELDLPAMETALKIDCGEKLIVGELFKALLKAQPELAQVLSAPQTQQLSETLYPRYMAPCLQVQRQRVAPAVASVNQRFVALQEREQGLSREQELAWRQELADIQRSISLEACMDLLRAGATKDVAVIALGNLVGEMLAHSEEQLAGADPELAQRFDDFEKTVLARTQRQLQGCLQGLVDDALAALATGASQGRIGSAEELACFEGAAGDLIESIAHFMLREHLQGSPELAPVNRTLSASERQQLVQGLKGCFLRGFKGQTELAKALQGLLEGHIDCLAEALEQGLQAVLGDLLAEQLREPLAAQSQAFGAGLMAELESFAQRELKLSLAQVQADYRAGKLEQREALAALLQAPQDLLPELTMRAVKNLALAGALSALAPQGVVDLEAFHQLLQNFSKIPPGSPAWEALQRAREDFEAGRPFAFQDIPPIFPPELMNEWRKEPDQKRRLEAPIAMAAQMTEAIIFQQMRAQLDQSIPIPSLGAIAETQKLWEQQLREYPQLKIRTEQQLQKLQEQREQRLQLNSLTAAGEAFYRACRQEDPAGRDPLAQANYCLSQLLRQHGPILLNFVLEELFVSALQGAPVGAEYRAQLEESLRRQFAEEGFTRCVSTLVEQLQEKTPGYQAGSDIGRELQALGDCLQRLDHFIVHQLAIKLGQGVLLEFMQGDPELAEHGVLDLTSQAKDLYKRYSHDLNFMQNQIVRLTTMAIVPYLLKDKLTQLSKASPEQVIPLIRRNISEFNQCSKQFLLPSGEQVSRQDLREHMSAEQWQGLTELRAQADFNEEVEALWLKERGIVHLLFGDPLRYSQHMNACMANQIHRVLDSVGDSLLETMAPLIGEKLQVNVKRFFDDCVDRALAYQIPTYRSDQVLYPQLMKSPLEFNLEQYLEDVLLSDESCTQQVVRYAKRELRGRFKDWARALPLSEAELALIYRRAGAQTSRQRAQARLQASQGIDGLLDQMWELLEFSLEHLPSGEDSVDIEIPDLFSLPYRDLSQLLQFLAGLTQRLAIAEPQRAKAGLAQALRQLQLALAAPPEGQLSVKDLLAAFSGTDLNAPGPLVLSLQERYLQGPHWASTADRVGEFIRRLLPLLVDELVAEAPSSGPLEVPNPYQWEATFEQIFSYLEGATLLGQEASVSSLFRKLNLYLDPQANPERSLAGLLQLLQDELTSPVGQQVAAGVIYQVGQELAFDLVTDMADDELDQLLARYQLRRVPSPLDLIDPAKGESELTRLSDQYPFVRSLAGPEGERLESKTLAQLLQDLTPSQLVSFQSAAQVGGVQRQLEWIKAYLGYRPKPPSAEYVHQGSGQRFAVDEIDLGALQEQRLRELAPLMQRGIAPPPLGSKAAREQLLELLKIWGWKPAVGKEQPLVLTRAKFAQGRWQEELYYPSLSFGRWKSTVEEDFAREQDTWRSVVGDPDEPEIQGLRQRGEELQRLLARPQLLRRVMDTPGLSELVQDLVGQFEKALLDEHHSFSDLEFYLTDPRFLGQVYKLLAQDLSPQGLAHQLAVVLMQDQVLIGLKEYPLFYSLGLIRADIDEILRADREHKILKHLLEKIIRPQLLKLPQSEREQQAAIARMSELVTELAY